MGGGRPAKENFSGRAGPSAWQGGPAPPRLAALQRRRPAAGLTGQGPWAWASARAPAGGDRDRCMGEARSLARCRRPGLVRRALIKERATPRRGRSAFADLAEPARATCGALGGGDARALEPPGRRRTATRPAIPTYSVALSTHLGGGLHDGLPTCLTACPPAMGRADALAVSGSVPFSAAFCLAGTPPTRGDESRSPEGVWQRGPSVQR